MLKKDFLTVVEIVKQNKMKKMEVIHLMMTLQKAVRDPELKKDELWNDFRFRCGKE